MTSVPVRDPLGDHLIAPQNAAFLFIAPPIVGIVLTDRLLKE